MARQVIHYRKNDVRERSLSSLAGDFHFHFCVERECRLIYSDRCDDVRTNGRCHAHRGVARRPIWVSSRDPQECCMGNTEQVKGDDLVRYALAGPGPWFQCSSCYRAHGWPCAL